MTEATNSKRLYFASAPILLVAHWLDTLEISILTGKIRLLCEEIIGGRQTLLYDPEIVLASRALYLGCAILPSTCAPSTPAQDFCGVFLVGKGFDTNKLVLSFEERFRLWLSMCLMPYLYDRREQLASHIGRMYCVLTEQEELHQGSRLSILVLLSLLSLLSLFALSSLATRFS